jgi:RNA polymerase sigma-70 factor (ECF subfamily)
MCSVAECDTRESLATAFSSVWRGEVADPVTLDAELRCSLLAARCAFPTVAFDDARAVRYLARRVPSGVDPLDGLRRMRVAELVLTLACSEGERRAIGIFDEEFLRPAATALVRAGHEASEVDEAAQTFRERLFVVDVKIQEFSGRGSLAAWTRASLGNQVISLHRAAGKAWPIADEAARIPAGDPELGLIRQLYADAFRRGFDDAFALLTAEQRTVLRLHFVEGLNLERIAKMFGTSRATVGRRMLESKRELLRRVRALLAERLGATPSEVESLLAVVKATLSGGMGFGKLLES